jgi:hypothetical protein
MKKDIVVMMQKTESALLELLEGAIAYNISHRREVTPIHSSTDYLFFNNVVVDMYILIFIDRDMHKIFHE